ncbi:MAG: L,D-transpeptidase [Methylocystis sp.]|nr:MAG: L,D-transpeptidase [Methylocystis sp.]
MDQALRNRRPLFSTCLALFVAFGGGAALAQFGGAPPDEYPSDGEEQADRRGILGPVIRPDTPRRTPRMAELPPDADPGYARPSNLDDDVDFSAATRTQVDDPTGRPAGTITIDTNERKLYLSIGGGQAYQYDVGVGREGFDWKGTAQIGRKAFWPSWTPPKEMVVRRPEIPRHVEGGFDSPLGARALYLFRGDRDTMFRIHGTNEPDTIGYAVSSGCIRMMNADVIDLYNRVPKGARVVVF